MFDYHRVDQIHSTKISIWFLFGLLNSCWFCMKQINGNGWAVAARGKPCCFMIFVGVLPNVYVLYAGDSHIRQSPQKWRTTNPPRKGGKYHFSIFRGGCYQQGPMRPTVSNCWDGPGSLHVPLLGSVESLPHAARVPHAGASQRILWGFWSGQPIGKITSLFKGRRPSR